MKSYRKVFLALLFLLVLAAPVSGATYKRTIKTSTTKLTMVVGEKAKIRISGYSYSKKRAFTIQSTKVVKKSGQLLLAKKAGTAKVTIKQGSKKAKLKVTVKDPQIVFAGKFQLSEEGFDPVWSSSSPGIIGIDKKTGAIEVKAIGRTSINAVVHGVKKKVTVEYLGGNMINIIQGDAGNTPDIHPTQTPTPIPTQAPTSTPVPTTTPTPLPTQAPSWDTTPTPIPQVEPGENTKFYVLNTNTFKFHYPECKHVAEIYSHNRRDVLDTRENIIAQGYAPCKTCDP